MITSLSINTDISKTLSILSDMILLLPIENGIEVGIASIDSLLLDPREQYSYIESINGVKPLDDGSINILGSLCVSLHSPEDPIEEGAITDDDYIISSEDQIANIKDASILMYDGCTACLNCQDIWKLYEQLLLAHLWSVAMKDCILYALQVDSEGHIVPVASALWEQSIQKEITSFLKNTGIYGEGTLLSKTDRGCSYTYKVLDPYYRLTLFNKAKRLLQEYKATVAIWNYLCFLNTTTTQILLASEDWAGFVVQTKKKINNCNTLQLIELTSLFILLLLIKGQLESYLSQLPLLRTAARKMLLLVLPVALNTYIEVGTDTGNIKQHAQLILNINNLTGTVLYQEQESVSFSVSTFRLQQDSIFCLPEASAILLPTTTGFLYKTRCQFLFKQLPQEQLILSAAVKILPVIVYAKLHTGLYILLDVTLYVLYRSKCTDIHSSLHAKVNLWKISLGWQNTLNADLLQTACVELTLTRYYTTGFCKYPSKLHLDLELALE